MFLVKDSSPSREKRILEFLNEDPALSVLLSVIHFEWTIRRAIIALGTSPNVEVRKKLNSCHGANKYKDAWKEEVFPQINKRLPEVIEDWTGLRKAWDLRHKLVHGRSSCSKDYAQEKTICAIKAARNIRELSLIYKINLDQRLPIRRRK